MPRYPLASAAYWEAVAAEPRCRLWRQYADAVNCELVLAWTHGRRFRRALKTDAFDEAVGGGVIEPLRQRCDAVHQIDLSFGAVSRASFARRVSGAQSDVRRLPYRDSSFDLVVSLSTLDHFDSVDDIHASLREFHRILAPGGALIITLDNLGNPVVRLRNGRAKRCLMRAGIVPYHVGPTLTGPGLAAALERAGLNVDERRTILHVPRAMAVAACAAAEKLHIAPRGRRLLFRSFGAFEWLKGTPAESMTGYFVAALATRGRA